MYQSLINWFCTVRKNEGMSPIEILLVFLASITVIIIALAIVTTIYIGGIIK